MTGYLTEYLRSLEPGGSPPDHAAYDGAREKLRGKLVGEMMRRGLWSSPPAFLGLAGAQRWTPELIDELVSDCYEEIFVHRLRMLRNQLLVRDKIEGLITRCVRNFLHDLRRESDPLGYQLYNILDASLGRLRKTGALRFEPEATRRVHNQTLCVFAYGEPPPATPEGALDESVRQWNGELWPEILEAQGRARKRVLSRLDGLISQLPTEGIKAFHFKDLIGPMKNDLRHRWRTELARQAQLQLSAKAPEESLAFRNLRDCVRRGLEAEPAGDRENLLRLWDLLWSYAAGQSREKVADKADRSGRPPTELGLAKALGLTRHRISTHKTTLGRWIETCQGSVSSMARPGPEPRPGTTSPTSLHGTPRSVLEKPKKESNPMDASKRRELLRVTTVWGTSDRTEQEEERTGSSSTSEAQPGDVLVLPAASHSLVEWIVVEVNLREGRVWIVPGDDRPMLGSRDLAIDAAAMPGISVVRWGLGAWIDMQLLDPLWFVGQMPADIVERVLLERAADSSDSSAASPEEVEAEEDPEYQRWRKELEKIPQGLEATSPPSQTRPQPPADPAASDRGGRNSFQRVRAVAASALLALGLGIWGGWIYHRQEMENLEMLLRRNSPVVTSQVSLALLRPLQVRGEANHHEVPAETAFVHLVLPIPTAQRNNPYRLHIRRGEEQIWDGRVLPSYRGEVSLLVSRQLLTDGEYRIDLMAANSEVPAVTALLTLVAAPRGEALGGVGRERP